MFLDFVEKNFVLHRLLVFFLVTNKTKKKRDEYLYSYLQHCERK